MEFLGQIVLVLMLLTFFGMIFGVKSDRVVTTYLNLLMKVLEVIGELLIKLAIPLLKQIGEKIVYTTNHYLAEHQKKQPPQIADEKTITKETVSMSSSAPSSEEAPASKAKPQAKPASANPYDDPPEPEIMD